MENPDIFRDLDLPVRFLTSLGIGLLLGLQRQRTPNAKAGLRTFALIALLGAICGFIAETTAGAWIVGAGLLVVGLAIVAAYRHDEDVQEDDMGTTTVIAALLCFALGVMVWYGHSQLAVAIAIVATTLLQFKTELHGFSARLSRQDLTSILQFGVLSFVVLPLLPDHGYGPYAALNPHHVWLMVVLVSGVSLAGYMALRLLGARQSLVLVGVCGGLVSSTATTVVYARQVRLQPELRDVGGAIITISNLTVLARFAVITAIVAPAALPLMLPLFGGALLVGVLPLAYRLRPAAARPEFTTPDLSNPAQIHVAIAFGGLYALVLVATAWLSSGAGSEGLYGLATVAGLVDVDAITLSSLRLFNGGAVGASVAATAIGLAYMASVVFKLLVLAFAGDLQVLKGWGMVLAAPAAALGVALLII